MMTFLLIRRLYQGYRSAEGSNFFRYRQRVKDGERSHKFFSDGCIVPRLT